MSTLGEFLARIQLELVRSLDRNGNDIAGPQLLFDTIADGSGANFVRSCHHAAVRPLAAARSP